MVFVDLGAISDPAHVATTLATMLGLVRMQGADVECSARRPSCVTNECC